MYESKEISEDKMLPDFSNLNDQDIPTQSTLSWKKSDTRVAVNDCSVTECWQGHLPCQTCKTVQSHAKHNTC